MITNRKIRMYGERACFDQSPITADLFLTDFCNLKCAYCRYAKTSGEEMGLPVLNRTLDILKRMGVRGVIVTGGGEALLHSQIEEVLEALRLERPLKYGINTNLVRYVNLKGLFEWIKVSVDGYDGESYERYRGRDRFDQVVENLRRLRVQNARSKIGVQAVIHEPGQAWKFVRRFKDEPVDYISLRPIEVAGIDFYQGKKKKIREELRKLEGLRKVMISYKWGFQKGYVKCWANWSVINVDHRGLVPYCCNRPNEIVGSIFDPRILEKKRGYRLKMEGCEIPCRLTGLNDEILGMKPIEHLEFV